MAFHECDNDRLISGKEEQRKRITFCEKYIPVLQKIVLDNDQKYACENYSAYLADTNNHGVIDYLKDVLIPEAYESNIIPINYRELVEENGIMNWIRRPDEKQLRSLDAEHILACIGWHFRRDRFVEGSLISDSIAHGYLLCMLKMYLEKTKEKS